MTRNMPAPAYATDGAAAMDLRAALDEGEVITLAPGERRTVEFKITEPMLRFYDAACRWVSEPGEFNLSTGYADHLILTRAFTLK